jgi:hypothetical protein
MGSLIQQSYPLACHYYLASNFMASLRFRTGLIATGSGASHLQLAVDQSVRYVEEVFSEYKQDAHIDRFSGRVTDVGPGDNCGVGLLFLQDGCASVALADRFYARRNVQAQASICAALWRQNPGLNPFLQAADLEDETTFKGLTRWHGPSAVELRDHGMFSGHFHEWKSLEPGDRPHYPSYEEIPSGLKEESQSYVRSIRHKFAPSFHHVDDEDLCVASALMIVRKN